MEEECVLYTREGSDEFRDFGYFLAGLCVPLPIGKGG